MAAVVLSSALLALLKSLGDKRLKTAGRLLAEAAEREASLRRAADAISGLTREILDTVLYSGNNPTTLMRLMENRVFIGLDSDKSIVKYFPEMADVKYHGLAERLRDKAPSLTDHEILLCSLIAMGITPEYIRLMCRHENTNTIYNKFHRIRRKLGVAGSGIKLESYLQTVISQLEREKKVRENFRMRKF